MQLVTVKMIIVKTKTSNTTPKTNKLSEENPQYAGLHLHRSWSSNLYFAGDGADGRGGKSSRGLSMAIDASNLASKSSDWDAVRLGGAGRGAPSVPTAVTVGEADTAADDEDEVILAD